MKGIKILTIAVLLISVCVCQNATTANEESNDGTFDQIKDFFSNLLPSSNETVILNENGVPELRISEGTIVAIAMTIAVLPFLISCCLMSNNYLVKIEKKTIHMDVRYSKAPQFIEEIKQGHFNDRDNNIKLTNERKILNSHQDQEIQNLLSDTAACIDDGMKSLIYQNLIVSLVITAVIALICKRYVDGPNMWWNFSSAIAGGAIGIISPFIVSSDVTESAIRCAYKGRTTVKFAYRIAQRAGFYSIFIIMSLGFTVQVMLYRAYKDLQAGNSEANFRKASMTIWPFILTSGIVAIYYRISGILMERTTDTGEIMVAEGDRIEDSTINDPACVAYDTCEQFNRTIAQGLEQYALFSTFIALAMTIQTSSPQLLDDKYYYFPIILAGFVMLAAALTVVLNLLVEIGEETEDHLYIQRKSRKQSLVFVIIASLFIWIAFRLFYNNLQPINAGNLNFLPFFIVDLDSFNFQKCSFIILVFGLLIALSSEFFTSQSCPPARGVAEASSKGLPLNILSAQSYGNVISIIFVLLTAGALYFIINIAGGLGIAYAGIVLSGFLMVAGVFQSSYGIASSAQRIAKISGITNEESKQNMHELDLGFRQVQYVSKGLAIFAALYLGFGVLAFYGQETGLNDTEFFDSQFIAMFIIGAAFPILIAGYLQLSIGVKAQEMIEIIKQELNRKEKNDQYEIKHKQVQAQIISNNCGTLWKIGGLIVFTPILTGILVDNDGAFPFALGAILVGYFMAVNTSFTTGLLESSKEWMIFKMKYRIPKIEMQKNDQAVQLLATGEHSLKTAMISGAMGMSQKDIYLFYSIFVQILCVTLVIFHKFYPVAFAYIYNIQPTGTNSVKLN